MTAAVTVLVLFGFGSWAASRWHEPQEYYFGGIACSEVRAHLDGFATGGLPASLRDRIDAHLRQCPACQSLMQEMDLDGLSHRVIGRTRRRNAPWSSIGRRILARECLPPPAAVDHPCCRLAGRSIRLATSSRSD